MPLRRHPVPRVQAELLRQVTDAQLVKGRDVERRRVAQLDGRERGEAERFLALIEAELDRRAA